MGFDWRTLPPEQMEQHFNPRVAVADAQARLDEYASRSAEARRRIPGRYDIRYGERPKETLDLHHADSGRGRAPLVLFIHGGFWRALDKSDHSFVVPPLLAAGATVANVNYDLCPTVGLDVIVDEIANAVRFCHTHAREWGADPNAMVLLGHSAGAHLAAEMVLRTWPEEELAPSAIRGVAALSGVYEPEVILSVTVNEEARIDRETAVRRNCLNRELVLRPDVVIAAGSDEPVGWIAQSEAFAERCKAAGLRSRFHLVPGANHFTILERAIEPGHALNQDIFALWR